MSGISIGTPAEYSALIRDKRSALGLSLQQALDGYREREIQKKSIGKYVYLTPQQRMGKTQQELVERIKSLILIEKGKLYATDKCGTSYICINTDSIWIEPLVDFILEVDAWTTSYISSVETLIGVNVNLDFYSKQKKVECYYNSLNEKSDFRTRIRIYPFIHITGLPGYHQYRNN